MSSHSFKFSVRRKDTDICIFLLLQYLHLSLIIACMPDLVYSFCVLQRPGVPGAPLPGRAILSMNGLSFGVIRVNTEDKNSALTVQDVGHVMPGGKNVFPIRPFCEWSGTF